MDVRSLPRYRGLPDELRAWGEADGHGKKPSLRFRDYLAVSLILLLCVLFAPCVVLHLRFVRERTESSNSLLEQWMEEKLERDMF
jgi:hypothetical protein